MDWTACDVRLPEPYTPIQARGIDPLTVCVMKRQLDGPWMFLGGDGRWYASIGVPTYWRLITPQESPDGR